MTRYCPSCLFEVPASTAKRDNNKCMRNCFRCPSCLSIATAVGSGKDESRRYSINCSYCDYKTGPKYDKQSSLATQVLNDPYYRQDSAVFSQLKAAYMAMTREPSRKERRAKKKEQSIDEAVQHLSLAVKDLSELRDSGQNQSQNDSNFVPPLLQHLKPKTSKTCQVCQHVLTKPDPRPASTKFKVKLMALNYLPQLSLIFDGERPAVLRDGETRKLFLTITNPMTVNVKVNISAVPSSVAEHPHKVTIVNPNVELGPASELWDEMSLVRGVPPARIIRETNSSKRLLIETGRHPAGHGGVYERGPNWATVVIEYTVSGKVPEAQMALFISFSFSQESETEESKQKDTAIIDKSPKRTEVGFWGVFPLAEKIDRTGL